MFTTEHQICSVPVLAHVLDNTMDYILSLNNTINNILGLFPVGGVYNGAAARKPRPLPLGCHISTGICFSIPDGI